MARVGWRDTALVAIAALATRAAIVAWAVGKILPIDDGKFYHGFATRLAEGRGYTVAWDDGTITYAAHYPVGYPAILSLAYRVLGATPNIAMAVNAALGVIAAACAHRIASRELSRFAALAAGMAIALHPGLVFYTPAVMTEGVAAGLVVIALACAPHGKTASKYVYYARWCAMGVGFGVATLVRPQLIALAPLLAFVSARDTSWRMRAQLAGLVLGVALVTVAPWTIRNCARMNRCALVSVNGGWNLLIGVQTDTGTWTPMTTPVECETVWSEADKDSCFEHAARRDIARAPLTWLAKIPSKLSATFDIPAAGPFYLHRANPRAFDERPVVISGAIEAVATRALVIIGLLASAPLWRIRRKDWSALGFARFGIVLAGAVIAFTRTAWPAYVLLSLALLMRERDELPSRIRRAAGIMLAATIATHAVFFGANRYALIVAPLVALAAFVRARLRQERSSATVRSVSVFGR